MKKISKLFLLVFAAAFLSVSTAAYADLSDSLNKAKGNATSEAAKHKKDAEKEARKAKKEAEKKKKEAEKEAKKAQKEAEKAKKEAEKAAKKA